MTERNYAEEMVLDNMQKRGQDFYVDGFRELNGVVFDEEAAKEALLLGYVTGNNVVLVGEPGGGKTTLSSEAHRLVSDIDDDNVARVPHHSDLTPNQLIGGSVKTKKTIENGEETRHETTTTKIDPIIHKNTQLIWLDELSRVNPFAVNAVLGALENGKITTDSGEVTLRGLELAISTMNPSETRQATFPIAAATASRHAIGAVMGGDKSDSGKRGELIDALIKGWTPTEIKPVINTKELHALRFGVNHGVAMPEKHMPLTKELIVGAVDALAEYGFHEADARVAKHITTNARGLAVLRGQKEVEEREIRDAVRFTISARLGIMGVQGARQTSLHDAIENVVNEVIR